MADLLFELGSEELPARFVVPALDDLERLFKENAAAAGIKHGAIKRFGTPRRLALLVEGLAEKTDDVVKEFQGPAVKAAFDEAGNPKIPALKFAESVKLPVEQLKRVATPRGEYLIASIEEKGRPVSELLPEVLTACVKKLPFPKAMRWGDVEQSFGRPLQWIVALFGTEVVPVIFSDVRSGRDTRGHRFLTSETFPIDQPSSYETVLEKAHVIASLEKRRALLVDRLAAAAQEGQGTLLEDESLVDQVLNLVELPNPVVGSFDQRHLDLPPEVLIQEMKSHQRYFALTDGSGKLLPKFIAVSNTPVKDLALSRKGYERVLRARLTDGRFFFDEDRKITLEERLPKLARRNWIQGLGSMTEKTDRIVALAGALTGHANLEAVRATAQRAALLCKCDLETGMVGEFPELQGVMGREYATYNGEPATVALAINEHYLPRGANDSLPTQDAGAFVGLADRFDSLCGLFGIGKKPTGAKDEYALRRAAIAVINIIIGRGYRLSLDAAVELSLSLFASQFANQKKKVEPALVKQQVLEFIQDRLRPLWGDEHRADIIEAVIAAGTDDLVAAKKRIDALGEYVRRPEFAALAATFKRVANIVEKQAKDVAYATVEPTLLQDEEEKTLHAAVTQVQGSVHAAWQTDDYALALEKVVPLKPLVDAFFDKVMVMAEDKALRENRVRLLMAISDLFRTVADFSKIQG